MKESIDCKLTRLKQDEAQLDQFMEDDAKLTEKRGSIEEKSKHPTGGDWIGTGRKKNSVNEDSYNGNIYVRLIHDWRLFRPLLGPFYGLKRFNYWSISFFLLIHPALFPTIPGLMAGALLFNHNY